MTFFIASISFLQLAIAARSDNRVERDTRRAGRAVLAVGTDLIVGEIRTGKQADHRFAVQLGDIGEQCRVPTT